MTFWKKETFRYSFVFSLKGFLLQINSLVQILPEISLKDHLAVYPKTSFMTMAINLSDEDMIVLKLKEILVSQLKTFFLRCPFIFLC